MFVSHRLTPRCFIGRSDSHLQIYTSIGPEEIEQTTVWQRGLRVGCNSSLPQKMDGEVTIPSGGYWGPITASTEWCERNYQATPYIAEFYNTLSNFPGIILAFIGLIYSINQKFERRFSVLHLSTIALGIGSILFHATLQHAYVHSLPISRLLPIPIVMPMQMVWLSWWPLQRTQLSLLFKLFWLLMKFQTYMFMLKCWDFSGLVPLCCTKWMQTMQEGCVVSIVSILVCLHSNVSCRIMGGYGGVGLSRQQQSDETPMVWVMLLHIYVLYSPDWHYRSTMPTFLFLYGTIFAVLHSQLRFVVGFQLHYVFLALLCLPRMYKYYIHTTDPLVRNLAHRYIMCLVLGAICWLVDRNLCHLMSNLWINPQGHALWHIFTGFNSYFGTTFLQFCRAQQLDWSPKLCYLGGVLPYVKVKRRKETWCKQQ